MLAVLVNGKPVNELANGSVNIPFDTEYVIRLRNKDKKRRVVAKVFVDGENVAEGGVVVPAGGCVDLEAPVGTHKRFRFVSLDSPDAVDFGKNGPNVDKSKGLVEAHFHYEKQKPDPVVVTDHHHHHYHNYDPWWLRPRPYYRPMIPNPSPFLYGNSAVNSVGLSSGAKSMCSFNASLSAKSDTSPASFLCEESSAAMPFLGAPTVQPQSAQPQLSDGCTVEGSYSAQTFNTISMDYEETSTVLKLFLQGYDPAAARRVSTAVSRTVRKFAEETSDGEGLDTVTPSSGNVFADLGLPDAELELLKQKRLLLEKKLEESRIKKLEQELAALE
ncbi:MAG: hypothetical protein JSS66_06960 [Armatimonadetes bacterium]|nr:hypothetical protein [Armatimonadota bacterium]